MKKGTDGEKELEKGKGKKNRKLGKLRIKAEEGKMTVIML